jgi:hypothetical protein
VSFGCGETHSAKAAKRLCRAYGTLVRRPHPKSSAVRSDSSNSSSPVMHWRTNATELTGRELFMAAPLKLPKGTTIVLFKACVRRDRLHMRQSRFLALVVFLLSASSLIAQDTPIGVPGTQVATEETPAAAVNTDALRKAAQNPVASLISVPIQENWNFGIAPNSRIQNVMNVQPVIPLSAGKDWNLIIRWITPVIFQPVGAQSGFYGFGDMQPAFFFSPKKGKLIWGVGPQLLLPTATKTGILGQGKFGLGPTAVVLVQPGKWTLGALVNNVWSVAGHSDLPDVNQFLLQYFINYNLQKGWYLTWQPTLTANWQAANGGRWVVPFGGGIGRIMKIGFQPVNVGLQFYGNAVHPPGASPWGMRLQIAFLFPKLTQQQQKMMLQQKLKQMEQQPGQK